MILINKFFGYSDEESSNEKVKCTGKYKKFLLIEIRVTLFILWLGLKSSLFRQNQQSSPVLNFFLFLLNQQSS